MVMFIIELKKTSSVNRTGQQNDRGPGLYRWRHGGHLTQSQSESGHASARVTRVGGKLRGLRMG